MNDLGWNWENADEGGVDAMPNPSRTRRFLPICIFSCNLRANLVLLSINSSRRTLIFDCILFAIPFVYQIHLATLTN
jgi:hypothetical protein